MGIARAFLDTVSLMGVATNLRHFVFSKYHTVSLMGVAIKLLDTL